MLPDGVTLIGPGSEWLWLMAQFLTLAITGLAVYRQLAAQRAANLLAALNTWGERWESGTTLRARLAYYRFLQAGSGQGTWSPHGTLVLNQFESLGYLVSQGHIRARDVADVWGSEVSLHWALVEPYVGRLRAEQGSETFQRFEELERSLRRIYPRLGITIPDYTPERIAVELTRCSVRVATDLRLRREAEADALPAPADDEVVAEP